MQTPFPIIPSLTTIAIRYRNEDLIADRVLPRAPVATQAFRYKVFDVRDAFTLRDTKVGRTSQPGQVEFGAAETPGLTRDYALDAPVPYADVQNAIDAGGSYDPEAQATEIVTDLIALDREVRVAGLVFAVGSYGTLNKQALVKPWDDPTSTPIADISDAMDSMLMRPNQLVLGNQVASGLRRNPQLVKAFYGNLADTGLVPLQWLADFFGLKEILVGQGWLNTAAVGAPATMARVWGKSAALLYRNPLANIEQGMTFGLTAQWGPRIAGRIEDKDMGMRGGTRVRVGESVAELIEANDLGYLFTGAHS